ncbi:MAG: endonuclease III [Chloroflexota bacterium]
MSDQTELAPLREKYAAVFDRLVQTYGRPEWSPHAPPVDEQVMTILSQNTADINTARAFVALRDRFPDWTEVMDAPVEEVIEAIRPAGLANQKGPRIQNALRTIWQERGELSLDFLNEMPLEQAEAWLTHIKGVGRKTAAIVMLFAFGRPAFPVDTHVHRVTGRLGLIPEGMSADKAHDWLAKLGDPDTFYPMHIDLIRHGREVCRARSPLCERCPLTDLCDYYNNQVRLVTG